MNWPFFQKACWELRKKQTLAPKDMHTSRIDFYCVFKQIKQIDLSFKRACWLQKVRVALTTVDKLISSLGYFYLSNEVMELDVSQCFCKAISNHLFRWDIRKLNFLRS